MIERADSALSPTGEYADGEYRWPTMYGTYYVPMLVLQFGVNTWEILFWDDVAENYEFRYVDVDSLSVADGPGEYRLREETK